MRILVASLFSLMFSEVRAQVIFFRDDALKLFRDSINISDLSGRFTFSFDDETTCTCTFYRGRLHGQWYCNYQNGSTKVKGFFVNGQPAGRWVFSSPDKRQKAVIHFENLYSYRLRYVRQGLFSYPVKFGRGELNYFLGDRKITVQYRRGRKEGVQKTQNLKGEDLEVLNFKNGFYHGSIQLVSQDRYVWKGQYEHGIPVGEWSKLDKKQGRSETISFLQKPYHIIGGRPYAAPFDKLWEQYRVNIVTDNFSENMPLFLADTGNYHMLDVLEDAFIHNKTVFYEDMQLEKPYIFSLSRQSLLPRDPERPDTIVPFAFIFTEYVYFSRQTYSLQNMLLHCSMLLYSKKDDSLYIMHTPLIYFPQSYRELTADRVHGDFIRLHFDRLLNGEYVALPIMQSDRDTFHDTMHREIPDIRTILFFQAELMNTMQNLIMMHIGMKHVFVSGLQE